MFEVTASVGGGDYANFDFGGSTSSRNHNAVQSLPSQPSLTEASKPVVQEVQQKPAEKVPEPVKVEEVKAVA